MPIKDLTAKQGNVTIDVEVVEVGEPREFVKFGNPGKVATAIVKDDTGQITLSLWNEQISQVKPGSKIKIVNGYVKEWQGELQLTTGMRGSIEVLGVMEAQEKQAKAEKKKTAKKETEKEKNFTGEEEAVGD